MREQADESDEEQPVFAVIITHHVIRASLAWTLGDISSLAGYRYRILVLVHGTPLIGKNLRVSASPPSFTVTNMAICRGTRTSPTARRISLIRLIHRSSLPSRSGTLIQQHRADQQPAHSKWADRAFHCSLLI